MTLNSDAVCGHPDRPGAGLEAGRGAALKAQQQAAAELKQAAAGPAAVGPSPLDERDFAETVRALVADQAPRVFAVLQVYGERVDGRIVAWGLAFDAFAEVFVVGSNQRLSLRAAENALRVFHLGGPISARLVWLPEATPAPPDYASAGSDHTSAGSDHTSAESDSGPAQPDHGVGIVDG